MKIKIDNLIPSEIDQLVFVHKNNLPDDILTNMNTNFLKRTYRKWMNSETTQVLTAKKNNEIIGFLVLSLIPSLTMKALTEDLIYLFFSLLHFIVRNPKRILELVSFISPSNHILYNEFEEIIKISPEIYILAISKNFQRQGIGHLLINEVKSLLVKKKIQHLIVRTSSNDARSFYEKNKFLCVGKENRGSRKLDILTLELEDT